MVRCRIAYPAWWTVHPLRPPSALGSRRPLRVTPDRNGHAAGFEPARTMAHGPCALPCGPSYSNGAASLTNRPTGEADYLTRSDGTPASLRARLAHPTQTDWDAVEIRAYGHRDYRTATRHRPFPGSSRLDVLS